MLKLIFGILLAFLLLPIHLLMIGICYILAPILPLFALNRDTLPSYLSWFQTPDAPLDGDSGFQRVATWVKPRYLRRIMWLWRNPAYGFSWSVLAARPEQGTEIVVIGDIESDDNPYKAGWSFTWVKGTHYWQVRAFIKTIPNKCLKSRFGWKMRYDALTQQKVAGSPYKFTFTFNPFKARR